jgi:hypothetical protein
MYRTSRVERSSFRQFGWPFRLPRVISGATAPVTFVAIKFLFESRMANN